MSDDYLSAVADIFSAHAAMRPPNRVPVSKGAADNLIIKRPGSAAGPYSIRETPYMREPMDMLSSRRHDGVVFVGPAQSGKTAALGEGWMTHCVVNDPGDMLICQMTQDKAREYSKQRIDRAILNSPALQRLKGPNHRDDNTHDKQFAHGMWLKIAWPTVANFSSTSYRYVFLTDYDRMPDNLDGEGDPWGLGSARTRTFMSRGMICAESSPGRPMKDPGWTPARPHEAPPTGGILGIYNRSDCRRWYWRCPHCDERFEAKPGMDLFGLPSVEELITGARRMDIDKMARDFSRVVCPNSGCLIAAEEKQRMNESGVWCPSGGRVTPNGLILGEPHFNSLAGYWLGGVAATYTTWPALIRKYLSAILDYANNGSEEAWKTTVNTDQGAPYMPRALVESKRAVGPQDRKEDDLARFVAPVGTRCLLASVDVQGGLKSRFEVQVHAIGMHGEEWPIDRYAIKESRRVRGDGSFAPIEPAVYPEDWDVLTERVLRSTYRVAGSELELRIKMTGVDTGGEQKAGSKNADEGTTANAYAWARRLRREGLDRRVKLLKGTGAKVDFVYKESMVGGKNGAGDVALNLLATNALKDMVDNRIRRTQEGMGFFHIPGWWTSQMFEELNAETRNVNGTWTQHRARNETFDLCCYIRVLTIMLGMEKRTFWDAPPAWAKEIDENSERMTRDQRIEMRDNELVGYVPAPAPSTEPPKPFVRRTGRSSSMR